MAELVVRRLRLRAAPGDLLRALDRSGELDTRVLVCLAGNWADRSPVICWNPARQVSEPASIGAAAGVTGAAAGAVGGGWFGWWSYSGPSWFGFFEQVLRRDAAGDWWLESIAGRPAAELAGQAAVIERIGRDGAPPEPVVISGLTGTSRQRHLAAVEQAIAAIRAGELYQANICARFQARVTGSAVELFAAGLARLAPDYAAVVQTPARTVVSFSPELFLHRDGDEVRTAPIKGTRRRLGSAGGADADRVLATDLRQSAKDRAENVMIVDLMRNDLSRVCLPGSVSAPHLLSVRPAPGVWHLVSEVTGRLHPAATDSELLAACFPPGSVTGAPKIRARQLIAQLEEAGRGVFTGAIGYLSPLPARAGMEPDLTHPGLTHPSAAEPGPGHPRPGRMEFNVAIRTFEIVGNRIELGVGGGITADSVPMQEWQECLVKAAPLLALGGVPAPEDRPLPPPEVVRAQDGLIETMLAVDGRIIALADHLARLQASCLELYRLALPTELPRQLHEAVAGAPGRHRVRLRFGPDLPVARIEVTPAGNRDDPVALYCHTGRRGSWRHKWADRQWLDSLERADGSWPLFLEPGPDGRELALETSWGNLVVICRDGVLRTPELAENVLPGITRRRVLDAALDRGRPVVLGPVLVEEVRAARLVLSLSSIRGVAAVGALDGCRLAIDRALLAEIGGWLA